MKINIFTLHISILAIIFIVASTTKSLTDLDIITNDILADQEDIKSVENEPSIMNGPIESQFEKAKEVYIVEQIKDAEMYTVIIEWDLVPSRIAHSDIGEKSKYISDFTPKNHRIRLLNADNVELQNIPLAHDIIVGMEKFEDLNFDGYTDISINTGGTINETHEFYIWNSSSKIYEHVTYESEMLAWYSVNEDGYIENFLRGSSPEDSCLEKLIWNGNKLVKMPAETKEID